MKKSIIFLVLLISCVSILLAGKLEKYLDKAEKAFQDRRYSTAIDYYGEAIDLEPNCALFYSKRAKSYMMNNDFNSAIRDINKAISIEPQNPDFYCYRGELFEYNRDKKNAVADYTMAKELGKPGMDAAIDKLQPQIKKEVFAGIGASIKNRGDGFYIEWLVPNSPAEEEGILADDKLVAVDTTSITGLTLTEVVSRIRGEAGTQVSITVKRADKPDLRTYLLTRRQIVQPAKP
jgi:C-terminal processing protease CtpA/Prc